MQSMIDLLRQKLIHHRVYGLIRTEAALRLFMEYHVVAVWDFMSLVKSLQFLVCGHRLPWVPPSNTHAARLLNEIIVTEETDCVGGEYKSHFELYLEAMGQVGCNRSLIDQLLGRARSLAPEKEYEYCLEGIVLPRAVDRFIRETFAVLRQPVAVQAAVFFHARENIIPSMFCSMVKMLSERGLNCSILLDYLERHVRTDSEIHGPMAARLLAELYGDSPSLRDTAESWAIMALEARLALWDEIADSLSPSAHLSLAANTAPHACEI